MSDDTIANHALDALMTTRAIRRFTTERVSDADIETCLRAAQQATWSREVARRLRGGGTK